MERLPNLETVVVVDHGAALAAGVGHCVEPAAYPCRPDGSIINVTSRGSSQRRSDRARRVGKPPLRRRLCRACEGTQCEHAVQ